MIPHYLPRRISDAYLQNFVRSTLKLGGYFEAYGFLVRIPQERMFRRLLWRSLSLSYGNFTVRGITPLPESGVPVLPILFPEWMHPRGPVVFVRGRIHDFSLYSEGQGRFVVAEEYENRRVEDYLQMEKPGIGAAHIEDILDYTFFELAREAFTPYFLSSSMYLNRIGGSAITVFGVNSKHYAHSFPVFREVISRFHNLLRKDSFKVKLIYDSEFDVVVSPRFTIRYDRMEKDQARRFYQSRRGSVWEKSVVSESSARATTMLMYSDIPYIPTLEEVRIGDLDYLQEYSLDIGLYVFHRHLQKPQIDEGYLDKFKMKLISRIEREYPDIVEAMRLGILMDMGDVNGMGEHAARVVNAFERLGLDDAFNRATALYIDLFSRIGDIFGTKIRRELSSLNLKKRRVWLINRVLWELNMLRPQGWTYRYFAEKMEERGFDNIERIFNNLLNEGVIYRKREDLYLAAANLQ